MGNGQDSTSRKGDDEKNYIVIDASSKKLDSTKKGLRVPRLASSGKGAKTEEKTDGLTEGNLRVLPQGGSRSK